jgi:hypothetical protein
MSAAPAPPSWWKYIAGRDADKQWSAFYASTAANGGEFSERDHDFYLNAVMRLANDSYQAGRGRRKDAVKFWLICRYQLGIASGDRPNAAARDTAELAYTVGIAKGHTPHAIQSKYANQLEKPAKEFLDAMRNAVMELPPGELPELPSEDRLNRVLTVWVERMVKRMVQ